MNNLDFYLLLLMQIFMIILSVFLSRKNNFLNFFGGAYLVYVTLIAIPFFIIYAGLIDIYDFQKFFRRDFDSKTTLDLYADINILIYTLLCQFLFILPNFLLWNSKKPIELYYMSGGQKMALKCMFILAIAYTGVRYSFYPDFPLFNYISSKSVRDIAFEYGTNQNVFYLFLPSINSQVYRILLPVCAFGFLYCYRVAQPGKVRIWMIFSILVVLALNFGTFKRTPILYLVFWMVCYFNSYTGLKSFFLGSKYFSIVFICGALMTTLYSEGGIEMAFSNMLYRVLVGEAIGEYLALLHFGSTFEHLGGSIYLNYFSKILMLDGAMAFSEHWKILVGGTRGYTSIGVFSEGFVSFGYFGLIVPLVFGVIIAFCDHVGRKKFSGVNKIFISGMITVVSFMMVKGLMSQMFTGGLLTLILLYLVFNYLPGSRRTANESSFKR
jgi:hypothetical protein